MKAVRVNEWGKPVEVENRPQPVAGENEVVIKVKAAAINPVDNAIAAGYLSNFVSSPLTLGADYSGEVVAVGEGVSHVKPGDTVYGMSPAYGTFAEYAVVKAHGVARKPETLDHTHAAAVPLAGLTAWQTLFDLGKLESGERVLIHGAGGGIGVLAVQLAKDKGAFVIAHDKGDKADFLRSLGADIFIDADTQRFEDEAGEVDVILDLVGGEYQARSFDICGPGARYITPAGNPPAEEAAQRGFYASGTFTQPTVADLTALAEMIDSQKLQVFVDRTFPLEQIADALAYKRPAGRPGKVVVSLN